MSTGGVESTFLTHNDTDIRVTVGLLAENCTSAVTVTILAPLRKGRGGFHLEIGIEREAGRDHVRVIDNIIIVGAIFLGNLIKKLHPHAGACGDI